MYIKNRSFVLCSAFFINWANEIIAFSIENIFTKNNDEYAILSSIENMYIIPAILEKTNNGLVNQLYHLTPYFTRFHIDIADLQLVHNTTIQIEEITESTLTAMNKKTFDFHLMVEKYQSEFEKLHELSSLITINTVFVHLTPFEKNRLKLNNTAFQLGIVLNPEDEVSAHWEVINTFSAIQIMSVQPGFQGASFLPETLEKINELREKKYPGKIYLDGGINDKTLPLILRSTHLPDVLCVGSYLKENSSEKLKLMNLLLQTELNH